MMRYRSGLRRNAVVAVLWSVFCAACSIGSADPGIARDGAATPTSSAQPIVVIPPMRETTTTQPAARERTRTPRGDTAARVVGYYAGWEREMLSPASLPMGLLTHVNYAFASVTADSRCRILDPANELPVIAALQQWKRRADAKTLLAVGGWEESRHFSAAAATAEGRDALVASCLGLARSLGFDGIDLDWEYPSGGKWPGRLADPSNHVALIRALRAALAPGELLTIATPASPSSLTTFGITPLVPLVDWFNVMAYDLAGPWDERTGHNAPIDSTHGPFGALPAIEYYQRAGVPPAKLVLGVPFYGHIYAGVAGLDGPSAGLQETFTGPPRSAPTGALTYRAIAPLVAGGRWVRHWDDGARVPWLVDIRNRQLISYDDAPSMTAKARFALDEGLGGMMIWELSGDDAAFTLLRAMNEALGRRRG